MTWTQFKLEDESTHPPMETFVLVHGAKMPSVWKLSASTKESYGSNLNGFWWHPLPEGPEVTP